ncbi:MAG: hypothetical protein MJE68_32040 [Proteobacteria bacterium]|nr:hypothetical protein [Pseudomonadota bacterium]
MEPHGAVVVGEHAKKEIVELERQRKLLVNLMQFKGEKTNKNMIVYFAQEEANAIVPKFLGRNFIILNIGEKKNVTKEESIPRGPFCLHLKLQKIWRCCSTFHTWRIHISPTTIHVL